MIFKATGNRRFFTFSKFFVLLALLLTLAAPGWAEKPVSYREGSWDGSKVVYTQKDAPANATEVKNSATEVTWTGNGGSEGWYYVPNDAEIKGIINVTGEVHLILCDGATLSADSGIRVQGDKNTLHIHAQSEGENMGQLVATGGSSYAAGIGGYTGNGGTVIIHGGIVTANGGSNSNGGGAGIGGAGAVSDADSGRNGGTVTIYGGVVTATGGKGASKVGSGCSGAGIGGGAGSIGGDGGTVTIYGGVVTATGGDGHDCGAGIGGGAGVLSPSEAGGGGNGGPVTIYGGVVTATGGNGGTSGLGGAGIGGGSGNGDTGGNGGTVKIYGGIVTATGDGLGAGIGRGQGLSGSDGTLTLGEGVAMYGGDSANPETNGGRLTAKSGEYTDERYQYMTAVTHVARVTLSSTDVKLNVGETVTLSVDVFPGGALSRDVKWSVEQNGNYVKLCSDNAGTALQTGAMEAGTVYVKAEAVGTAKVIVKSVENDKIFADCVVTVMADLSTATVDFGTDTPTISGTVNMPVTSVNLPSPTVKWGDTPLTSGDDYTFSWTAGKLSNGLSVAADGSVTGKPETTGNTTATANYTLTGTGNYKGTKTGTLSVNITVSDKPTVTVTPAEGATAPRVEAGKSTKAIFTVSEGAAGTPEVTVKDTSIATATAAYAEGKITVTIQGHKAGTTGATLKFTPSGTAYNAPSDIPLTITVDASGSSETGGDKPDDGGKTDGDNTDDNGKTDNGTEAPASKKGKSYAPPFDLKTVTSLITSLFGNVEIITLSTDVATLSGDRSPADLSTVQLGELSNDHSVILVVLPEITPKVTAVFVLGVSFDITPEGTLKWHGFPKTAEQKVALAADEEECLFLNDSGEEVTTAPANGHLNVAVLLSKDVTYAPVITAETATSTGPTSSKDGGGCDAGLGGLALAAVGLIAARKH